MGVLKKLFVIIFLLLWSCSTYVEGMAASSDNKEIEYVSVKRDGVLKKSRDASVEVSSYDYYGNLVGGSGAYIKYKDSYYILTAAHVVSDSSVAMVSHGKEKIIAEVFYCDEVSDIALLSIEGMFTRVALDWRVSPPRS